MDVVRIGRESNNDVVFSDGEVSRYHCELYCTNGRVYIRDLDSTNGTQVNGKDILSPVALKIGDDVVLGHKVRFDWYSVWSKFYSYTIFADGTPETIRYGGQGTLSNGSRPLVDIPSSIHIHQQQEHAEVLKKGDDFQVNFKRNLGNNIGHHVGNTLGCIISIIIIVSIFAIIGLIISS